MLKSDTSLRHIERYEFDNSIAKQNNRPPSIVSGWRVKIKRGPHRVSRSFGDRKHGGKEQSLAAACRYRDEVLAQTSTYPLTNEYFTHAVPRKDNTSGHPGVSLLGGYWMAKWREHKTVFRKLFSIAKLGFDAAKEAAISHREKQVERIAVSVLAQFGGDMRGITRMQSSWWVRLGYKDGSPEFQKSFTDRRNGGITGALRAALLYRDYNDKQPKCSHGKQSRYEREGFQREITSELYEQVTKLVNNKVRAFEYRNVRSDLEQAEIVQEVLLAYASKPDAEIRDVAHYLNALVVTVASDRSAQKHNLVNNNPTLLEDDHDDD